MKKELKILYRWLGHNTPVGRTGLFKNQLYISKFNINHLWRSIMAVLLGSTYGNLTVIEIGKVKDKNNRGLCTCKCICGNYVYARGSDIEHGKVTKCEDCRNKEFTERAKEGSLLPDKDFIGNTYNYLKVLGISESKTSQNRTLYDCECTLCGKVIQVRKYDVIRNVKRACSDCLKKMVIKEKQDIVDKEMIGNKFGKLTVISRADRIGTGHISRWLCRCECGNEVYRYRDELINKYRSYPICCNECSTKFIKSDERKLDNLLTTVYNTIRSNVNEKGIPLYRDWLMNPKSFFDWAINNGFALDTVIIRKDDNKDYDPENCIIIPKKDLRYYRHPEELTVDFYSIKLICKELNIDYKEVTRIIKDCDKLTKDQLIDRIKNDPLLITQIK